MKKFYAIVAAVVMMTAVPYVSNARDDFFNLGIRGGLNFSNMTGLKDMGQEGFLKTYTGFNAGLVFNFNLPLGFELNPELLYVQSGFKSDVAASTFRSGSIRVPVNIQWGIDLFNFIKPYVVVSPYVGAVLFGEGSVVGMDFNTNDALNRFQYGVGLGFGVYVWKFQVSFKWNWDLNPILKDQTINQVINSRKFNGGELSLAFLF